MPTLEDLERRDRETYAPEIAAVQERAREGASGVELCRWVRERGHEPLATSRIMELALALPSMPVKAIAHWNGHDIDDAKLEWILREFVADWRAGAD